MNTIIKTNQWIMGITAVLYLTLWGGVLFQLILGLFHIIIFLRLLFKWSILKLKSKIHLTIYGIITTFLIILAIIYPDPFVGVIWISSFGLIVYFAIILNKLKTLEL